MTSDLVKNLSRRLITDLKEAEEIFVAVALMNFSGLNFILNNIRSNAKQNYLIGIDLPTEPKVFKSLHELQYKSSVRVKIFTGNQTFHPKLYLIRKGDNYSAFVGSANCTNGGLVNNVELTIRLTDPQLSYSLIDWFEQHFTSVMSHKYLYI